MNLDADLCYRALASRDARFDGRFYTAVRTTGIYCRPICPARTPGRGNVIFFPCAAAAEDAGYRPCRRCRPDGCPGTPEWNGTSATVSRALRLIHDGALDRGSVVSLSERLGIGTRHLSRLFAEHLGASPVAFAQTRRAHFARRLIEETTLPMTEVAYSSGFSSIRRFNDAIMKKFGDSPTALRRQSRRRGLGAAEEGLSLHLSFRPPLAWGKLLDFLRPRCTPGVEEVRGKVYRRTLRCDEHSGIVEVEPSGDSRTLLMRVSASLSRDILHVVEKARQFFDLRADPATVGARLAQDDLLAPGVRRRPGLRVPGAWNGFELAVRAVLGQQVSVQGATTLAGRLAARLGETLSQGCEVGTSLLFPVPEALATGNLGGLGLTKSRQRALQALARAVHNGEIDLDSSADPEETPRRLLNLPGFGPWTVAYISMRALRHPDAFPSGDLGLLKAASSKDRLVSPEELTRRAETWRPWRAYAAMHLWNLRKEGDPS